MSATTGTSEATPRRGRFWRVAGASLGILGLLMLLPIMRTFLFQPFSMPSGSMKPTLIIGDYFFVAKYSYGYSRYSLPFSPPLFSGRIFASEPERGDVVVFRLPKDTSTDYVKRVIGLPGDRIQMIGGAVHLNGQALKRERIEDFTETEDGRSLRIPRWRETLPNGVSYATLDLQPNSFYDNTPVFEVSAGHYFMLGDHRDNSADSRALNQVGYVPFANIIGKVTIVFLTLPGKGYVRYDRMFTPIH
jgi:signal peptidase I